MNFTKKLLTLILAATTLSSVAQQNKPDFEYTQISGVGYEKGCTRRDPSDIIRVGDKYYIYYTKVYGKASGYWGTIWCAVSEDQGYNWKEVGEVLGVGEEGTFDSQATFTPNIIYHKGKYYMYYTGVCPTPSREDGVFENNSTNDYTNIGVAVSDTPDGKFERVNPEPILRPSTNLKAFDSYRIDDAVMLYKDKKFWLYYKGRCMMDGINGPAHTQMGVAFAEDPTAPFTKYGDPILAKGHEVMVWQENGAIQALASISSTIEQAPDGLDFTSQPLNKKVENRPNAPGAFREELTNPKAKNKGLEWGISMIHNGDECYLVRFSYNK
ncbi:MAG: family 43 glycosylhydrolase [Rikenellaceae bacterium]